MSIKSKISKPLTNNDKFNFSESLIYFDLNDDLSKIEFKKFTDIREQEYNPKFFSRDTSKGEEEFKRIYEEDDINRANYAYNEFFKLGPYEEEIAFNQAKLEEKQNKAIKTFNMDDLLDEEVEPMKWLVKDVIPGKGLVQIAAKPKVGKTWFCFELATAVATGGTFMGYKVPQGKVLYLDLESSKELIIERFNKYFNKDNRKFAKNINIYYDDGTENNQVKKLKKDDNGENLITQLEFELEKDPDISLIVIDTIKYIRSPSGNKDIVLHDTEEMKTLHDFCNKHSHLAVICINHLNKDTVININSPFDAINGSHGIIAGTDCNIIIYDTRNSTTKKIEKTYLWTQGRYSTNQELIVKFDNLHWNIIGTLDENEYLDKKSRFLNKPLVQVITEWFKHHDTRTWECKSKDIIELLKENGIFTYTSQQVRKELSDIQGELLEFTNIFYKPIQWKGNSTQHSFSKGQQQVDLLN